MLIFSKKKWIQSVIILCIVSTGCFASSNEENDLLQGQRTQVIGPNNVNINVVNDADLRNSPTQQAQRILAITAVVLEAGIEALPFILACTSDRSSEHTLASLGQNVLYASLYAFRLARDSYSHPNARTSLSNLAKVVWLANTMNSSIAAFSCWRYYETLESNYRLINMGANGVVGTITFPLKMLARRKLFHKLWYGRM